MFTGIVEEIGSVRQWQEGSEVCQITITAQRVMDDIHLGDSIAVNGVCLTAAALGPTWFRADVMVESLRRTALAGLSPGAEVNLERALQVGGRLGGHWVTGHIDGVGTISQVRRERNSLWYHVQLPADVLQWLVPKGSVSLDGTSLTVAALEPGGCVVSLIPHTAAHTILGQKAAGDKVNVEADVLGKYVKQFMSTEQSSDTKPEITLEFLQQTGMA